MQDDTTQPDGRGILSVVMPAFNEQATIAKCLGEVLRQPLVGEVIVVDDGSTDRTVAEVERVKAGDRRVSLLRKTVNEGKGAALRDGFQACTLPYVIVQDADLEYQPSDYAKVLAPLLEGRADVCFGSRFLGGGAHRVLYFWHSIGNKLLTLLSNAFTDLNLSDMETGVKVFKREVIQQIRIRESRFGFEPEITAKVAHLKVPIYEVPVSYYGRTYAEGKKIHWKDGFRALWCIVKYRFVRD